MEREPLYALLDKVKARITFQRGVRLAFAGLLGGSAAGVLLLGIARLFPLLHVEAWLLVLSACGFGAGVAVGVWKRATVREAARAVDHGGAEDAVNTALDVLEGKTRASEAIVRLQREAASHAAVEYVTRLKEKLPWPTWKQWRKTAIGLMSLWLIAAALLLYPNPMKDKAQAMSETKAVLEELQSEIEESREESNVADLNDGDRLKLEQTLEELRKELESLGLDNADLLEELAETLEKLSDIAEDAKQAIESFQDMSREMSETRGLEELGKALEQMDAAAVDEAVERLRNEMKELSQQERDQLAGLLEELASMQDAKGAESLQEALQAAAEQMRNSEASSPADGESDGLSALQDALGEGLSKAALEQLARSMADRIREGGSQLAEGISQQGGDVPSSWSDAIGKSGSSGSNSGSGGSSGEGQGGESGNQGSGQNPGGAQGNGGQTPGGSQGNGGQSPGQGQGSAPGNGGQGAGSGSGGQGSGAGSGSGGQGSGAGSGSGGQGAGIGTGDRNLVTTPRHLEGEGNVEVDGGPTTGGETQSGGQSPVIDGATRPYEDVYSEYAAEAKKTLGRTRLPASLQDKVKQYFDEIQPDR